MHDVHARITVAKSHQAIIGGVETTVIDEVSKVVYVCEEGDLETEDQTEVATHVVAKQFLVRQSRD